MHGAHYGGVSNPVRWLEVYLREFLPDAKIRVVNFARPASSSTDVLETFEHSLRYQPDLAVFYLGHNDFLPGNRPSELADQRRAPRERLRRVLSKSFLLSQLYREILEARIAGGRETDPDAAAAGPIEKSPARIDRENAASRREPLHSEIIAGFARNLTRIVELGAAQPVPLVFFEPASNLKDFAPDLSLHLNSLTPEQLAEWERRVDEARAFETARDPERALASYQAAAEIDDSYAEVAFRSGRILFAAGRYPEARAQFERARDTDAIVFRAPRGVLDLFDAIARRGDAEVLDTEAILAPLVEGGILGEPAVEDNVHFSIEAHARLGRALAQRIAERGWLAPREQWRFENERPSVVLAAELGIDDASRVRAWHKLIPYLGVRVDDRIRYAERALDLDPENATSLRHLAWSQWLKGDRAAARSVWSELARLHPESYREVVALHPEVEASDEASSRDTSALAP
jgi:tetratricopeptide (TPR) repeat protein